MRIIMPRLSQPRLPPRDRLLQAAEALFFQEGIVRVTVDAIAEKAGSTKMTLYRHFSSKEVLVKEWITLLTEDYSAIFDELARQFPDQPQQQILGFVRFITNNLGDTLQRGCPFTNTLAEAGDQFPEVRTLIVAHKQRQYQRLCTLCQQAGLTDAENLAKEITLLLEGMQVVAQNAGFTDLVAFTTHCIEQKLAAAG
jgi:AcrR family transcriptional regulator